jgi:MFS family permease
MPVSFASVPFTAYYLLFALSLIPAGNLTERYGPNPVHRFRPDLAGASVLGLALPVGIFEMTGFRALAGIGQGLLLIGVQSYILNVASPDKKTQGTAIIVLGFQGGMLSGMAIGSLLVNSLHPQGVFMVAGGVGLVARLYTLAMLPAHRRKRAGRRRTARHDAAPCCRLQKRDHRRSVSQGNLLHRNSREGAADWRHQFCHSADPHTAAVPRRRTSVS